MKVIEVQIPCPKGTGASNPLQSPQFHAVVPAAHIGEPASTFDLITLDGEQITNQNAMGQIMVLDFVAPGCPWCKRHLPRIALLKALYESEPVRFVTITG